MYFFDPQIRANGFHKFTQISRRMNTNDNYKPYSALLKNAAGLNLEH